jgi:3-oxoacyl-(acyl-carrier-protein) synthase
MDSLVRRGGGGVGRSRGLVAARGRGEALSRYKIMEAKTPSRLEKSMVQAERRVVITGLGVVAANGIGKEAFWHATSNGVSGIKTISRFPTTDLPVSVAGEVSNFVAEEYIVRKLAVRTDRMTHFAFATAQEALQDAGIELAQENPQRVGAVIANTVGGVEYVLEQISALHVRGPRAMSAFTTIAWLPVSNVGQISVRYGLQGYCKTLCNDTAGGLDALAMAYGAIRRGAADVIITGGCEALLEPYFLIVMSYGDFCLVGDDPNAYRPFDRRAAGLLLGEGAGMCILEEYEHAVQRGAPIYGEIVGYGQTNDAHGLRNSAATGKQYARAMTLAMREGNIHSKDVAYLSLDGRANPVFDQREVEALRLTFGSDFEDIPASVPRTMLGHSYAAAGVLDSITALLALQNGIIPPTINSDELDPRYELNLVQTEARPLVGSAVLIGGRGIGGANVALVIKKIVE